MIVPKKARRKVFSFSKKDIELSEKWRKIIKPISESSPVENPGAIRTEHLQALSQFPNILKFIQERDLSPIKILAEYKADLNIKDEKSHTPLYYAVEQYDSDSSVIKELMKCNLEVDTATLKLAIEKKWWNIVEILLKLPQENLPLLHRIVKYHKDATAIEKLYECKADLNTLGLEEKSENLMVLAAKNNKAVMMKTLLECGASLEHEDIVHYALKNHCVDVVNMLAENKIDIFKRDRRTFTPREVAAWIPDWDKVASMLGLNHSIVTDAFSCTIAAINAGNLPALQALEEMRIDLTENNPRASELMNAAIDKKNVAIVCMLAQQGIRLNNAFLEDSFFAIKVLLELADQKKLNIHTIEFLNQSRSMLKNELISYLNTIQFTEVELQNIKKSLHNEANVLAQILNTPSNPRLFKFTRYKLPNGKLITHTMFQALNESSLEEKEQIPGNCVPWGCGS